MPAYVFFDVVSIHAEQMTGYRDKALASIKAFDGKLVAATNNIECREGDWRPARIVMIEFPSMENARAWYESPEYQQVLPIRLSANKDNMVIFEGLP
jgi:uncharacterized protein (DUF1330 family)